MNTNKERIQWGKLLTIAILSELLWCVPYILLSKQVQADTNEFWWLFWLYVNPASLTILATTIIMICKQIKNWL